ncbi:unnamed protein product [Staurois parvus]|uniref:MHC class I antigen n=1 Tax=Staurois parvus TaxID=386267 RepID=A0ABN9CWP0_9NEOB|nr:unnamed protein product [Staurois parvus]
MTRDCGHSTGDDQRLRTYYRGDDQRLRTYYRSGPFTKHSGHPAVKPQAVTAGCPH